jgi:hypothetical protein
MENIATREDLRNAIKALEVEQNEKELILREHFHLVYDSLRPINIIKATLKDLLSFSSASVSENLSGTALGEAGGFLLKKMFIGNSGNVFRKLIGTLLQLGITNIASKKSDVIIYGIQSILQRLFHKKEKDADDSEESEERAPEEILR